MSQRGKALFDRYIASHVRDTALAALPSGTHAFNLTTMATELKIPVSELIEEVGPLAVAITAAKRNP